MWNVLFGCSVLSLQMFHCLLCLPASERKQPAARYTQLQGRPNSNPHFTLRKTERREWDIQADSYQAESTVASNSNADVWKRLGCGVPDYRILPQRPWPSNNPSPPYRLMEGDLSQKQRSRRFALFGGRWEKTDLTYKIMRFPWQMSEEKVRGVLQEALNLWSAVTPLRFREVTTSEPANIVIDFSRYWHGDNLPFDGPGGILAHAFFPRTHRQGEVHFDYDENWTVGNNIGTDLLQVAAHEFGHVLGLQHSLEPGAVMSPFYSDSYPLQLSEDDTRGIQYLYGAPVHAPPEITNEIDANVPDACRTNFNAVSMIRGELFFFKSRYVWRIRDRQLQPGYPALASRHWRGIPNHIDAAYEDKSGNIWFFQGGEYWVFDAERKITGPAALWALGLPVTHIQAALKWPEVDGSNKVYLLKSSSYWAFNLQTNQVEDAHPHSTATWEGLPSHIDAAFMDQDGYAVMLSGKQYWKFDPLELTVLAGYPRSIGQDFFGCAAHQAIHPFFI